MTKFFLPVPKGIKKSYIVPKKKNIPTSSSESLNKLIIIMLKKLVTRQIQRTIRKIHEEQNLKDKQKLQKRLLELKSFHKQDLQKLSYFIMIEEMDVNAENIKNSEGITLDPEQQTLSQALKKFYQTIKRKSFYKNQIQDTQRFKNEIADKKKTKKEKAKIKKKLKLQHKKEIRSTNMKAVTQLMQKQSEEGHQQSIQDKVVESQSQPVSKVQKAVHQITPKKKNMFFENQKTKMIIKLDKHGKTQFKKTGRNKFLHEKRTKKDKSDKYNRITSQNNDKFQHPKLPGRHETPHPSWQAKRQIKNQMFIQPFQGKRIML